MSSDGNSGFVSWPVHLRLVGTLCGAGTCPTVYRTDRGTFVVQGNGVAPSSVDVDVPAGEVLVEVPEDLLLSLVEQIRESRQSADQTP